MKYHNKWLKILYKLLTLYESCLNLEWNSWHRTNNFEISWNFWNVVNLCYLIYNLFITFQLNLSLFLLHIFKKNCINCQKKKKIHLYFTSISVLHKILVTKQFYFSIPLISDLVWRKGKERNISIFTRWNFSTNNAQGERRCVHHTPRRSKLLDVLT